MVATVTALSPVARPSCSSTWSRLDRADLARKLEALGTNITELSDVRECCSLLRLSESTPAARALAHHILSGVRGKAALESIRERRALLLSAIATCDRSCVASARALLGLRTASPSSWRLGELTAVYSQARLLEIEREAP